MNAIKKVLKQLWKDESGQGATEYILLLVVVVAIAILFRDRIMELITSKLSELQSSIGSFSGN